MKAREWIRNLRETGALKPSEVERISRAIADDKRNHEYYLSRATLADIEEKGSVPSIYKLFSLAACLGISYREVLLKFGVDVQEVGQFLPPLEATGAELMPSELTESQPFAELIRHLNKEETVLLEPEGEQLSAVSVSLRQGLDHARFRYAAIGRADDTMGDLIPPGSVIVVDPQQNTLQQFNWKALRERPIYLVRHVEGYSCCWCQEDGNALLLLPHPLSRRGVRRFSFPGQATILGRVVNVWVPFKSAPGTQAAGTKTP